VLTAQQAVEPAREQPRRRESSAAANLIRFSKSLFDSYKMAWQQIRMPLGYMLFA
jgi:hypothetical protein